MRTVRELFKGSGITCLILFYKGLRAWEASKETFRSSDPDHAAGVRERTLVSSLQELRTAAERLESLITDTRQYTGAVSLDISHGSMASRTAEGFYKTTINGADYLCDYFNHIGEDDFLT